MSLTEHPNPAIPPTEAHPRGYPARPTTRTRGGPSVGRDTPGSALSKNLFAVTIRERQTYRPIQHIQDHFG
jgi:hypothetical protein